MMGQNTDEHSLLSGHHSHCCAIRSVISGDCSRAAFPRRSFFSARGRATPLLRVTIRRRIEVSECIFGNSFFFSFLPHFLWIGREKIVTAYLREDPSLFVRAQRCGCAVCKASGEFVHSCFFLQLDKSRVECVISFFF